MKYSSIKEDLNNSSTSKLNFVNVFIHTKISNKDSLGVNMTQSLNHGQTLYHDPLIIT